ncbi:hypothetical protein NZD89_20905 [Alicyclobacillus fastidiosus]|uniref:Lipoprotein n=1 Tax=Alicyclobacillus fastidiosus TaxID=392011 RepID=A0ABY6ZDB4_9BACL|nr:hypothetical protein [Alicyclobacillus fastidiosus]WAH40735.1 hypothetical protein NZD89_20905 [Alicyclobacillus fastidiosus]GMA62208.1 hypothetical protein GCM10025859_26480 [Alicyclobacillus fastidiosus]
MEIRSSRQVTMVATIFTAMFFLYGCTTQQSSMNNTVTNPQQTTTASQGTSILIPSSVQPGTPVEVVTSNFRVIATPSLLEPGRYNILSYYIGKSPIQNNITMEMNGSETSTEGNSTVYPGTQIGEYDDISVPSGLDSLNMKIKWTEYGSGKQQTEQINFTKVKDDLKVENYRFYKGQSTHWIMGYAYEQIGNKSFNTGKVGDVILKPNGVGITIHNDFRYTVQSHTGKFTLNGPSGYMKWWSNSFSSSEPQFIINSPNAKVSVTWDGNTEMFNLNRVQ